MLDIPDIPNTDSYQATISQIGEGAQYTAAILRHMPAYLSPAASWCASLGEGWYLPTATELFYLFRIANAGLESKGIISQALTENGGAGLYGGWYWSCTEANRTEALNVSTRGSVDTENKSEENSVRAIRAF